MSNIQEEKRILNAININNIYIMLHEFRNWNKDWDTWMTKKPDRADEFVRILATKYTVNLKL